MYELGERNIYATHIRILLFITVTKQHDKYMQNNRLVWAHIYDKANALQMKHYCYIYA